MSSQFEKRKAKAEAAIKEKREQTRLGQELIEAVTEVATATEVKAEETAPVYTHEGYDIFKGEGEKYFAIHFRYNPKMNLVKIESIDPIQRGVGLTHENNKRALKTLLRKK